MTSATTCVSHHAPDVDNGVGARLCTLPAYTCIATNDRVHAAALGLPIMALSVVDTHAPQHCL